jgi:hypothetical protein
MRLQLTALVLAAAAVPAHADGTLTMRGVYYKERSTRVMQPMLDGAFEIGARGLLTGHLLVDAITSASAGSGAAAAAFKENREEGALGYAHELDGPGFIDRVRLGGDAKYSHEPDYRSFYIGARAEAELAQKNAAIGLGGGVSFDRLDNSGAQTPMGGPPLFCDNDSMTSEKSCPVRTYNGFASASQILSRDAIVAATYDISKAHGFLANPYRQVVTSERFVPERHPNDRLRQSVAVSARYYVAPSHTTLIGAYRYYWDDWDIHAHTPELRVVQEVGSTADASVRYRYYKQDAAFFYEKRYASPDPTMNDTPYFTDDPKMTAFDGHTFEAKLGMYGETFGLSNRWAGARFEGILEYIIQHNRFENAVVAHVALTVPFDY